MQTLKYAQIVKKSLIFESRFISIQRFGRETDGQYSRDAEQAADTRCDSSPAWPHGAAGARGRNRGGLGLPRPVTSQLGRLDELFVPSDDLDVSGHSITTSNSLGETLKGGRGVADFSTFWDRELA